MSVECRCTLKEARTGDINIAIMCMSTVLRYSAVAQSVQLVLEFPEGVALEIEACGVLEHSSKDAL